MSTRWMAGTAGALALLVMSCGGKDDVGDDAAHDDSHNHAHDEGASTGPVDRDDRCDIGFNTAAFNETSRQAEPEVHDDDGGHSATFTVEEFADVYVDPSHPMADGDAVDASAFVAAVKADPLAEEALLSGAMAHTLAPDNWRPMTDQDDCSRLAAELGRARQVAARYPTAADAEAAGYSYAAPFLPGIGAHYMNGAHVGAFDVDNPAMLLYDGDGPNASIVGLSYYIVSDNYPEQGFAGPNDTYHRHISLCFGQPPDGRPTVVGPSSFSEEECAQIGGTKVGAGGVGGGYMNHVWVVPGCESDTGLFSAANPAIKYRGGRSTQDPETPSVLPFDRTAPIPSGCGSAKTPNAPLTLDEGNNGPPLG